MRANADFVHPFPEKPQFSKAEIPWANARAISSGNVVACKNCGGKKFVATMANVGSSFADFQSCLLLPVPATRRSHQIATGVFIQEGSQEGG